MSSFLINELVGDVMIYSFKSSISCIDEEYFEWVRNNANALMLGMTTHVLADNNIFVQIVYKVGVNNEKF